MIGRLSAGYKKRYEHRVNVEWVGWNQSHGPLTTLARFVLAQSERESIEVGRVITRLLDNVFANARLEPHHWPLKWVAEDPARYYLGESGGVTRAPAREETAQAEPSGDPELDAIRSEYATLADERERGCTGDRREAIDRRLDELARLSRRRKRELERAARPQEPPS